MARGFSLLAVAVLFAADMGQAEGIAVPFEAVRDIPRLKAFKGRDCGFCNVGSNSGLFGFDWESAGVNGANFATGPQSLAQGFALLEHFADRLAKDCTVFIPICPFSSISAPDRFGPERQYKIYPFMKGEDIYLWTPERAAAVEKAVAEAEAKWTGTDPRLVVADRTVSPDEFRASVESLLDCWRRQFEIADFAAPLSERNRKAFAANAEIMRKGLAMCRAKGWRTIVVLPPVSRYYDAVFSDNVWRQYVDDFAAAARVEGVPYWDYSRDERFRDDANFRNSLMLNRCGSALFTKELVRRCRPDGAGFTLPIPIQWQFDGPTLSNKTYIADLDYIKANTDVDVINIAPVQGAAPEGNRLFHDALKELVEHAHKLGIRIIVRASPAQPQLFDAIFTDARATRIIDEPDGAQGLTYDAEAKLDADGCATFTEEARWALQVPKVTPPLRNDVVGAWVFEKTGGPSGDGFYRKGTLVDVTDRVRVLKRTAGEQTVRVEAGRAHAGKTVFLVTIQYFNAPDLFGGARFRSHKRLMDELSDIPLDGFCMDEQCGMSFAFSPNGGDWRTKDAGNKYDAFRFRYYTAAMARHFRERLGVDLKRLLLDMRYAPEGEDAVRIRAINLFWREVQAQPTLIENQVAAYQKKLFGPNVFLACHSTHHNWLDGDDAWKTGDDWWDLPRDYGFTDEYTEMPTRMGVLCATPSKPHFGYNMFYSKDPKQVYWDMARSAPFNIRQFHHSYNDGIWGLGFTEQPFTANVRRADRAIRPLDELQKDLFPRLDLLVLFGTAAQVNWYPERRDRNVWDVNGGMQVQKKADELWKAGYRCALVPDRTIDDGRLELKDGKYVLNGHAFTHCLFLYPLYATKKAYAFLNAAHAAKMPLAVVGRADLDFDADPVTFGGLCVDAFSADLAARIGCPKSAIPGGCVYEDGSFCLVSEAIATGGKTSFDFTRSGRRFRGEHTGVLLWRDGKVVYATPGWKMEQQ